MTIVSNISQQPVFVYQATPSLELLEQTLVKSSLFDIQLAPALVATGTYNPFAFYNEPLMNMNLNMPYYELPKLEYNFDFSKYQTSTPTFGSLTTRSRRSASSSTNSKAKDIVSVARGYIGYNESDGSYLQFTNGRREAWCADFVSYCAKKAGLNGPNTSSVEEIRQWGKNNGRYSTNRAKVGDAVIFKNGTSHTGIVESINGNQITCIEGNTSDKVARRTYSIDDPKISGFVTLA